jgi:hypothetical protein
MAASLMALMAAAGPPDEAEKEAEEKPGKRQLGNSYRYEAEAPGEGLVIAGAAATALAAADGGGLGGGRL